MIRPLIFISAILLSIIALCNPAFAQIDNETIQYSTGKGVTLKKADTAINAWTTFVFQGTPDSNAGGDGGQCGASWINYLSIEKRFHDTALIYLEFQSGLGQTIQNSLRLFSQVNYNAYDVGGNIKAKRYFYKEYFCDKEITILIGKEDPRGLIDEVPYTSSDDRQFLSDIFNRSPAIDWPRDYTFTVHANISPRAADFLEFEYNYMEDDADWERIQKEGLYTFQVDFKPAKLLNLDTSMWNGNYRFYSWLNTRHYAKLVNAGGAPSTETKEYNYGFGVGIDQMLGKVLGVFGRIGWQRPDLAQLGSAVTAYLTWSCGAQVTGDYWQRKKDVLGVAVGQIFPSKRWVDSANNHYGAGEGHIEAYYNFAITSYMRVGPDIQIIWNPAGASKSYQGDENPIFVYGGRLNILF